MDKEEKDLLLNLDDELDLLRKELEENDKIFEQVKEHYDKMLNVKSGSTLKFISDQTSNVMKIRDSRVNIIKEMINIKKLKADTELREKNLNKDINDENEKIKAIAKELYNNMKEDNREGSISNLLNMVNNPKVKENRNEEEYKKTVEKDEDILNKRMAEINAKKKKERQEKEIKERGYLYACDLEGNVYAINIDGTEVLEDIDIPDFQITFEEDPITKITIAKNQYGDLLDIIEIA